MTKQTTIVVTGSLRVKEVCLLIILVLFLHINASTVQPLEAPETLLMSTHRICSFFIGKREKKIF